MLIAVWYDLGAQRNMVKQQKGQLAPVLLYFAGLFVVWIMCLRCYTNKNVFYHTDTFIINTYSMKTFVLLHFEHKMTSHSLSNFCIELLAAGEKLCEV